MKNIITLSVLLIFSLNSFAQNKNICGEVNYTQTLNIGFNMSEKENYLMKFNSEVSYSEEININYSNDETTIDDEDNEYGGTNRTKLTVPGRTNLTPKFYYNLKTEFYFMDIFSNESLYVKEDNLKLDWSLHKETKQIGDFTCQKATTKFRGRNYIAWFTNEIPASFGPWKFHGLSGLILEVYDTDKMLHITTTKIKIDDNTNCSISVDNDKLSNSINISQYLNRKNELIKAKFEQMTSRMPKGVEIPKFDINCKDCPKGLEIFDEER